MLNFPEAMRNPDLELFGLNYFQLVMRLYLLVHPEVHVKGSRQEKSKNVHIDGPCPDINLSCQEKQFSSAGLKDLFIVKVHW